MVVRNAAELKMKARPEAMTHRVSPLVWTDAPLDDQVDTNRRCSGKCCNATGGRQLVGTLAQVGRPSAARLIRAGQTADNQGVTSRLHSPLASRETLTIEESTTRCGWFAAHPREARDSV